MRFLRRVTFYVGLMTGMAAIVAAGAVALTYLFTGKLPAIEFEAGKREVRLVTPDQMTALFRRQVEQARAAQTGNLAGGETDEQR